VLAQNRVEFERVIHTGKGTNRPLHRSTLFKLVVLKTIMAPNKNTLAPGKRGLGFLQNELTCLLDALEEFLPIGGDEWDMVERNHAKYYPELKRTKESLRRKFASLYLARVPTGDPNCPPEVRRAKYIHEEIKKRSGLSDGEAVESEQEASEEGEEDEDEELEGDPEVGEMSDHPAGLPAPEEEEPAATADAGEDAGPPTINVITAGRGSTKNKKRTNEGGPPTGLIDCQQRQMGTKRTKRTKNDSGGSSVTMSTTSGAKSRHGGGASEAPTGVASVVASIDSVVKLMLVSHERDAEDRKHEAKIRQEERKENQSFMQQMLLIMSMGQQQQLQSANQTADLIRSMRASSDTTSNNVIEIVDQNDKNEKSNEQLDVNDND
jgi:hypothetical protein